MYAECGLTRPGINAAMARAEGLQNAVRELEGQGLLQHCCGRIAIRKMSMRRAIMLVTRKNIVEYIYITVVFDTGQARQTSDKVIIQR
jgi:hypothetical protein